MSIETEIKERASCSINKISKNSTGDMVQVEIVTYTVTDGLKSGPNLFPGLGTLGDEGLDLLEQCLNYKVSDPRNGCSMMFVIFQGDPRYVLKGVYLLGI